MRSKYRSRFRRDAADAAEPEQDAGRAVRFQEQQQRERERVLDTEDVSKGGLSPRDFSSSTFSLARVYEQLDISAI